MLPPIQPNALSQLRSAPNALEAASPATEKQSSLQQRERFAPLLQQRGDITPKPTNSPDLRELPKSAFIAPASTSLGAGTLSAPIQAVPIQAVPRQAREFSADDKQLLNESMYYTRVDTETPSSAWVQNLPDGEVKNFYIARHFAKKGTDVVNDYSTPDALISGSKETVPNRLQSSPAAHLRQAAGTLVVEHAPGNVANLRQGQVISAGNNGANGTQINNKLDIVTFYHNVIEKLSQTVPDWAERETPVTVHVVTQRRDPRAYDANTNFLALGFQDSMIESLKSAEKMRQSSLGFSGPKVEFANTYQPVISRTVRSNASPMGRIIQQGVFGKGALPEGSNVIFVDDHVQAGGALMAAFLALKAANANIVGVGTFGVHPLSANGLFDADLQVYLKDTLAHKDPAGKIEAKLQDAGIELSSLTNFEVFVLLSNLCDPNNPAEIQEIRNRMDACAQGITLPAGQSDAFADLLSAPAASAEEVCQQIDHELALVPPCVEDAQISNVVFYDYDDTLNDEIHHVRAAFEAFLGNDVNKGGLGLPGAEVQRMLGSESALAEQFEAVNNSKLTLLKKLIQQESNLSTVIQARLEALAAQQLEDAVPVGTVGRIGDFLAALSAAKGEDGAPVLGKDSIVQIGRVLSNPALSKRLPVIADVMQKTSRNAEGFAMPIHVGVQILKPYLAANKQTLESLDNAGRQDCSSVDVQYAFAKRLYIRQIEALAPQFGEIGREGKALLAATRQPDTVVGLVSNKKHNRLSAQVAAGRLTQYFDALQGPETVLHDDGEVKARIPNKPHSGALVEQMEGFPLPPDFVGPVIGFGDKVTDGLALQALGKNGHADLHFIYMGKQPLSDTARRQLSGVDLQVAEGDTLAERQIKAKEIYLAIKP